MKIQIKSHLNPYFPFCMDSSPNAPQISVILPTLNEKENIRLLVEKISESLQGIRFEILIIDDHSPDGTFETARRLAQEFSSVKCFLRKEHRSFCRALQFGIDRSLGKVIIWMDCDLSHPPEMIPEMFFIIDRNQADAVVPSRFLPGSLDLTARDSSLIQLHKVLSRMLNISCRFILNRSFHDWTSGYIAVRSEVVRLHPVPQDYGAYFIQLIFEFLNSGYRIREIPFTSPPRRFGQSKTVTGFPSLLTSGWKYLKVLFTLIFRKYARFPGSFFSQFKKPIDFE